MASSSRSPALNDQWELAPAQQNPVVKQGAKAGEKQASPPKPLNNAPAARSPPAQQKQASPRAVQDPTVQSPSPRQVVGLPSPPPTRGRRKKAGSVSSALSHTTVVSQQTVTSQSTVTSKQSGQRRRPKGKPKPPPTATIKSSEIDSEEDDYNYAAGVKVEVPAGPERSVRSLFSPAPSMRRRDAQASPPRAGYDATDFLEHPPDNSTMLCYQFQLVEGRGEGDLQLREAIARKFMVEEVLMLPGLKFIDWFSGTGEGDLGWQVLEETDGLASPNVKRLLASLIERLFVYPRAFSDRGIDLFWHVDTDMAPPKAKGAPVFRVRSFGVSPSLIYHRRLPYRVRYDHNARLQKSEKALHTLAKYQHRRSGSSAAMSREEAEARYYDPSSGHPRVSRYMIFEGCAGGLIPNLVLGRTTKQDRHDDMQHDAGEDHEMDFAETCFNTFGPDCPLDFVRVSRDTGEVGQNSDKKAFDTRLTTILYDPHPFIITKQAAGPGLTVAKAAQRHPGRFGNVPPGVEMLNVYDGPETNTTTGKLFARQHGGGGRGQFRSARGRGKAASTR